MSNLLTRILRGREPGTIPDPTLGLAVGEDGTFDEQRLDDDVNTQEG